MVYFKPASGKSNIDYETSVEEALCFGWIDSTVKTLDKERTAQRFSPRKPTSKYSQANKERLRKLIKQRKVIKEVRETLENVLDEKFDAKEIIATLPNGTPGVPFTDAQAGTFGYMAAQLLPAREAFPTPSYPTPGLLPGLRQEASGPGDASGIPEGLCIGDPDRITDVIRKWESVGVDRVNFLLNCLETVPQQEVLDSLRLFAKDVMPAFRP